MRLSLTLKDKSMSKQSLISVLHVKQPDYWGLGQADLVMINRNICSWQVPMCPKHVQSGLLSSPCRRPDTHANRPQSQYLLPGYTASITMETALIRAGTGELTAVAFYC